MPTKTTSDLRRDMAAQPNLDAYLNDSRPYFTDRKLKGLLEKLYARCGFSKATLARLANMSEVYVYQVFAGRRHPTRDRLLALCVGWGPRWTRPRSSSARPPGGSCTPGSSGMPLSPTASSTGPP